MAQDIGQILFALAQKALTTNSASMGEQAGQSFAKGGGVQRFGNIAGAASALEPGGSGAGNKAILKQIFDELNPIQQNVIKTLMKWDTKKLIAAKEANVPNESIASTAGIPKELVTPATTPTPGDPSAVGNPPVTGITPSPETQALLGGQQPNQQPTQQPGQQPGQQLVQQLAQQPSQQVTQPNQAMELIKKVLRGVGEGMVGQDELLKKAQRKEIEQRIAKGGDPSELEKFRLDIIKEDFKQNRLDQRETLKAELKNDGVGSGAATLGGEVSDLIAAWDDVTLKGRLGGRAGGIASVFGFERGKRASFESFATSLSWKFGNHILGQKGRAFTENERADVEKRIIGAALSKSEDEFSAKMNAVITMSNNLIPNNAEKIPDFDTIRNKMKGNKSTQPGLSDAIAAEKKRRGLK